MPELPEVETVARGLRQAILGRRILSVTLGKTDFIDDPVALEQNLPGRQIEAVERYGKFMLLRLTAMHEENRAAANGDAASASLLVHLGMTGQIAPAPAGQPLEKHTYRLSHQSAACRRADRFRSRSAGGEQGGIR
jgi:formamidopyrimidine-DNA glycosylase